MLTLATNLKLPLEAVTQTFAILGKRGSGKTTTATVLTEELLAAHQHVIVIDPLDVTWGLRAPRDGQKPGYPVTVLGGDHADLPLESSAGIVLAEFVVEHHAPVILSLRHFSLNEQRRFVTDFCERLYALKGKQANRTALHVVIDEVDEFAHQRIPSGHERLFGAIDRLVRRGRASGIGVTMISQRPAVIHKDILSQAEVLICHQTISPQDRKALETWVEAHDAHDQRDTFMETIATLQRGEAWVWSPGWLNIFKRVQIRDRKTFDSSATPKAGETAVAPRALAKVDLKQLEARIASTIEKAKADDPRELRKRIQELERQVSGAAIKAIKAVSSPPVPRADLDRAEKLFARAESLILAFTEADRKRIDVISQPFLALVTGVRDIRDKIATGVAATQQIGEGVGRAAPRVVAPLRQPSPSNGTLGNSGLRRILVALAQRNGLSRRQLGVRAMLSSRSGTFDTYLSKGRTEGWIGGAKDRLEITEAGRAALGAYDPLPEGRALLAYWLGELGQSGAARILEALAAAYPQSLTRHALGIAANLSDRSGTFDTYLSKLRTLELIEGRSEMRASEELFG